MAWNIRVGRPDSAAPTATRNATVTFSGLEGLSVGNLAAAIGMSNSGLYAHFGSKQELQLATVEEAGRICAEEVVQPALAAPAGLAQLAAVCEIYVPMQGPSELGTTPDAKLARWDRTAELASIEVPTLVIGARHDTASHGPL